MANLIKKKPDIILKKRNSGKNRKHEIAINKKENNFFILKIITLLPPDKICRI